MAAFSNDPWEAMVREYLGEHKGLMDFFVDLGIPQAHFTVAKTWAYVITKEDALWVMVKGLPPSNRPGITVPMLLKETSAVLDRSNIRQLLDNLTRIDFVERTENQGESGVQVTYKRTKQGDKFSEHIGHVMFPSERYITGLDEHIKAENALRLQLEAAAETIREKDRKIASLERQLAAKEES